jgi:hypothetical protein
MDTGRNAENVTEERRQHCSDRLADDESGYVDWANAGKRISQRAIVTAGFANDVEAVLRMIPKAAD